MATTMYGEDGVHPITLHYISHPSRSTTVRSKRKGITLTRSITHTIKHQRNHRSYRLAPFRDLNNAALSCLFCVAPRRCSARGPRAFLDARPPICHAWPRTPLDARPANGHAWPCSRGPRPRALGIATTARCRHGTRQAC